VYGHRVQETAKVDREDRLVHIFDHRFEEREMSKAQVLCTDKGKEAVDLEALSFKGMGDHGLDVLFCIHDLLDIDQLEIETFEVDRAFTVFKAKGDFIDDVEAKMVEDRHDQREHQSLFRVDPDRSVLVIDQDLDYDLLFFYLFEKIFGYIDVIRSQQLGTDSTHCLCLRHENPLFIGGLVICLISKIL
jgi:hypothetical protein